MAVGGYKLTSRLDWKLKLRYNWNSLIKLSWPELITTWTIQETKPRTRQVMRSRDHTDSAGTCLPTRSCQYYQVHLHLSRDRCRQGRDCYINIPAVLLGLSRDLSSQPHHYWNSMYSSPNIAFLRLWTDQSIREESDLLSRLNYQQLPC